MAKWSELTKKEKNKKRGDARLFVSLGIGHYTRRREILLALADKVVPDDALSPFLRGDYKPRLARMLQLLADAAGNDMDAVADRLRSLMTVESQPRADTEWNTLSDKEKDRLRANAQLGTSLGIGHYIRRREILLALADKVVPDDALSPFLRGDDKPRLARMLQLLADAAGNDMDAVADRLRSLMTVET